MGIIKEKIDLARERVDDEKAQLARLDLRYIKRLVQAEMETGKYATTDEVLESINKKYSDVMFNNFGVGIRNGKLRQTSDTNRSDYFAVLASEYLRKNPGQILEEIDKSDRKELLEAETSHFYNYDMQKNIHNLVQNAVVIYFAKATEHEKNKFIEGKLSVKERVAMQREMLYMINNYKINIEKDIHDAYVRRVTQIATILDENGSLDKGIELHNRRLRMIGLTELQVSNSSKGGSKPQVRSMSDWKKPGIVNKLPLDTLIAASAFFTNRLCKEYISYRRAVFILKELKMIESLLDGAENEIDEEVLKEVLAKYHFLQAEARETYSTIVKSAPKEHGTKDVPITTTIEMPYTDEDVTEYREEFQTLLPWAQNDIFEDTREFAVEDDVLEEMYQKKDYALDTLIISLLNKRGNLNWGYIPETYNGKNSIERDKRMIQLGFDLEGFSIPIRLHHNLGNLREHVKGYTGSDEIPLYQGEDDWVVENQFGQMVRLTTQVFIPTQREERKTIKDLTSQTTEGDRLYNFLTHLNWIANRVTPTRFAKRKYVSLDTGKISSRDEVSLDD